VVVKCCVTMWRYACRVVLLVSPTRRSSDLGAAVFSVGPGLSRPTVPRPAPRHYPTSAGRRKAGPTGFRRPPQGQKPAPLGPPGRSEEHTSELQSRENLVCRLLLEKKILNY